MEKAEIQKQENIINLFNKLEDWKLDLLSENNPNMDKLTKEDHKVLLECIWVELEKEESSEKEFRKAMGSIIVLCTLESFRRKGLLFINKKGNYDKTDLGREVDRELRRKENWFGSAYNKVLTEFMQRREK